MTIHDNHRFQFSMMLTGRTPVVIAGALEGMADAWRIEAAPNDRRRATLVAPVLRYSDLGTMQEIVRAVRGAGAHVDETCASELRIDAARFDDRALRTLQSLLDKQAALLERALGRSIEQLRFERVKNTSSFPKGALAISLRPTLHTGELAAVIVLMLAIVERALTARAASSRLRPFDEMSARYDFRCFLLRLGLIGEHFRDAREQLLKRLPGDAAWRRGRPHPEGGAFPVGKLA